MCIRGVCGGGLVGRGGGRLLLLLVLVLDHGSTNV